MFHDVLQVWSIITRYPYWMKLPLLCSTVTSWYNIWTSARKGENGFAWEEGNGRSVEASEWMSTFPDVNEGPCGWYYIALGGLRNYKCTSKPYIIACRARVPACWYLNCVCNHDLMLRACSYVLMPCTISHLLMPYTCSNMQMTNLDRAPLYCDDQT